MTYNIVTKPRVTAASKQAVMIAAQLCLNTVQGAFPFTQGPMDKPFVLTLRSNGQRSNAGAKSVTIDVQRYQNRGPVMFEYKSYEHDPIIGGFYHPDPEISLLALVAHEMAHHIQFAYCQPHMRETRPYIRLKPHGDEFKTIYRLLREKLVNVHDIEPTSRRHNEFKRWNGAWYPAHRMPRIEKVETPAPMPTPLPAIAQPAATSLFPALFHTQAPAPAECQLSLF
tara:strand:- start:300 stop:977 length:678 start_codon:yes stop_codon:yes gene_type:complete